MKIFATPKSLLESASELACTPGGLYNGTYGSVETLITMANIAAGLVVSGRNLGESISNSRRLEQHSK